MIKLNYTQQTPVKVSYPDGSKANQLMDILKLEVGGQVFEERATISTTGVDITANEIRDERARQLVYMMKGITSNLEKHLM